MIESSILRFERGWGLGDEQILSARIDYKEKRSNVNILFIQVRYLPWFERQMKSEQQSLLSWHFSPRKWHFSLKSLLTAAKHTFEIKNPIQDVMSSHMRTNTASVCFFSWRRKTLVIIG